MSNPILTVEQVREHIQDNAEDNKLIDGVEFSPTQISLAMGLAIDEYNMIIPISNTTLYSFPNKALLMSGTLAKLFAGAAALAARNNMSYSDGGVVVPVEERFQFYQALAEMYRAAFDQGARAIKLQGNIEDGWGGVRSDYGNMPLW